MDMAANPYALPEFVTRHVSAVRERLCGHAANSARKVRLNIAIEQAAGWAHPSQVADAVIKSMNLQAKMKLDIERSMHVSPNGELVVIGEAAKNSTVQLPRIQFGVTTTSHTKEVAVHHIRMFVSWRLFVIAPDVITASMESSTVARAKFLRQMGEFACQPVMDHEGNVARYRFMGDKRGEGDDAVLALLIVIYASLRLWPADIRDDHALDKAVRERAAHTTYRQTLGDDVCE